MTDQPNAPYLFVIDTADYAGNFERDLCAYITGCLGKCEVGREEAELFKEETGQEPFENVMSEPDDHGCRRPVTIYPTPGWFNHGHGGHFRDGDEVAALADYKRATRAHYSNTCYHGYLKAWQAGEGREGYAKVGWTEEKLKQACAREEERITEADALTQVSKWPACLSVAISFETKPTDAQIVLMKERAAQFAALPAPTYGGPSRGQRISQITGFRLIKQTVKRELDTTTL